MKRGVPPTAENARTGEFTHREWPRPHGRKNCGSGGWLKGCGAGHADQCSNPWPPVPIPTS